MSFPHNDLLPLVGAFARPVERASAATALAHALGAEALVIFTTDPELGVLLPAPGLAQHLPGPALWRAFLERCREDGEQQGTLPGPDGAPMLACGCAAGRDVVAVLLGGTAATAEPVGLRAVLPLLGALFDAERRIDATLVRARSAASGRAEHAQVQAKELEMLNAELAARTAEAERERILASAANRAKSDFLAIMSHELRTPINAVIGYGELLEMEISGPVTAEQRAHLERIRSSSRHLLMLINDILDLARVESGRISVEHQPERVDEVVAEALALVQAQAAKRSIVLRNSCEGGVPFVGDRGRVRQILLNLLTNGIKFTAPGGIVSIECGVTQHPAPDARLKGTSRWTYIQVEDTGIGITANQAGRVFRPFVQAESGHTRPVSGTGLGLTISRQLARLMGGDLTLRSDPGRGSSFFVWLPTDAALQGALDESIRIPSA